MINMMHIKRSVAYPAGGVNCSNRAVQLEIPPDTIQIKVFVLFKPGTSCTLLLRWTDCETFGNSYISAFIGYVLKGF